MVGTDSERSTCRGPRRNWPGREQQDNTNSPPQVHHVTSDARKQSTVGVAE
jgi:hypothetical protein